MLGVALPAPDVDRALGAAGRASAERLGLLGSSGGARVFSHVLAPLDLAVVLALDAPGRNEPRELLFASDWPPPTALAEEPVMPPAPTHSR